MIYVGSFVFVLLLFAGIGYVSTSGVEKQAYRLLEKRTRFEIRYYPASIMATIKNKGSYSEFSGWAFRRLAGFILGNNDRNMKIAMTSPVRMQFHGDSSLMSFVMPRSYSMKDLPSPSSGEIRLAETTPAVMASLSFGGWANDAIIDAKTSELNDLLEDAGLQHTGVFEFLGYNPPYQVIGRRNEILVELTGYPVNPE